MVAVCVEGWLMIRGRRARWLWRIKNGQSDCQMAENEVPTVATRTILEYECKGT